MGGEPIPDEGTVVYDACVLYPAPLRDLLMWLATTDLFRARWTDQIHDEWTRNLLANRPDVRQDQMARVRRLMDRNVPHCLVAGFEPLVDRLILPDPDDRHVLAAAIHAGRVGSSRSTSPIFRPIGSRRSTSARSTRTTSSSTFLTSTPA